jgi:hypothetical protein
VVELEVHTHVDDLRDFVVEDFGRQAERRDVGAHQAARHTPLLEDGDRVTQGHQVVGHGQRRAAGADQRHLLAVLELGDPGQPAPDVFLVIRRHALQAADGDRLLLDAATPAGGLTGSIANASQDSREDVRMAVHHVGIGEAPLRNESNVFGTSVCAGQAHWQSTTL